MNDNPLRVLIVDDERSLREPLSQYLQQQYGFLVDTAATAVEAETRVCQAAQPYDVVLIDEVLMTQENGKSQPRANSVDLMVVVKTEAPATECIIFTGWGIEHVQAALRAGAYRYLTKTVSPDELAVTIQLAADHSRLKQQLQTTRQEKEWLQTFLKVGRATTSVLGLDEVLAEAYQQIDRLMKLAGMDVILYDEDSSILTRELYMVNGRHQPKQQWPFSGDRCLIEWIIVQGQPALVQDYPHDAMPRPLNAQHYSRGKIKSWLGVPLIARNKTFGVMVVHSPLRHQFGETDQYILTAIAGQVAVAIDNARLFRALHGERQQLEALTQSSFDAIIAIDTENRITVFNQQAEAMFGWTEAEMKGERVNKFHMSVEVARQLAIEINEKGQISQRQITLKHRNGTPIPTLLSAVLLKDEQGQPLGQAGFMRDMRQLNLLEERQQALMEVSRTITGSLALEDVLNQIAQSAVAAFPAAKDGTIHLFEPKAGLLRIAATTFAFSPGAIAAMNLKPGEGLAGWVFQEKEPIVAADVRQEPRYKLVDHPEIDIYSSMICVPLKVKERAIGALCLSNGNQSGAFQREDLALLTSFADQAAVAIDNARLYEESERRNQLLVALDEASRHIRGQKETGKLLQEIVRLAAELFGCTVGAFFINRPHLGAVELEVAYKLQLEPVVTRLAHGEGLIGQVAQSGQIEILPHYMTWPKREAIFNAYDFQTAIALPIYQVDGLKAVLFIADETGQSQVNEMDRDILERFAAQAAIALQTSRLLSQEQRMLGQLAMLHAISDYIQAARDLDKILHVLLTGITAGFGLGFNRAALFLLDEKRETLLGRMGIGHLNEAQTRADWAYDQKHGLNRFDAYLSRLEQNGLSPMPIGENVQKLHMPVDQEQTDPFSRVVLAGKPRLITQTELNLLPANFVAAFEPALPFIIVPFLARDQVTGLLVADNKFTQSPITSGDIEALMTFANTAALTIDNAQLLRQIESDRDRLRAFYASSNTLVSSQEPEKVLADVVENARQAAKAAWVTLALIGEDRQAQTLVVTDERKPNDISRIFRPDGLSMQVMDSGRPIVIEDARRERERVNPSMFQNDIAAAVCLPLSLQSQPIGVMWVHYDQPRHFTEAEIEALQLYVNQAALALDSARRIQALEQMRQTAQVVAQVTTLGDLHQTLNSVVSGTARVVGCDVVALYAYDQEKDWMEYPPATYGARYPERAQRFEGVERDSIVFRMLRQAKLYIVQDVTTDSYFRQTRFTQEEQIKSCVAIPLRVGNEKVGVMFVNFRQHHLFTEDELQTIELFAYQAAVAIRNAQLYKRSEERATRLMTLYEAGRALAGSLDLQTILECIVEQAPRVTKPGQPVNLACLRVIEGDESRVRAAYPPAKQARIEAAGGGVVNLKTGRDGRIGIMGRAALTGQSQLVGDVKADSDYLNCDASTRSEIAVPIWLNERVYAVISVEHEDSDAFDEHDLRALELLADQAAVAIQNARHAELLSIAAQVAREATASLEINELLNETVRLISERFGFYHVGALLLDEEREYAVLHAYHPLTLQERYGLGNQLKVGEEGIVGHVTQTGKYHLALDVHKDLYHLPNPDLPQTRAEMVVPLIAHGQVIGALDMQSDKPIQLSGKDIATIQTMADQLANAIRAAQLLQEVTEHLTETNALQEVALALTAAAHPGEVFEIVVKRAMELTTTEESSLLFWDAKAQIFSNALRTEPGGQVWPYQTHARSQGGRARHIIDTRRPIAVVDAWQEPDFNLAFIEQGHRASLGVPLLNQKEQAFGVLYVRSNEPRIFSEHQVKLLEALAGQAAVTIERAQHYEEMRQIKGYVGNHTAVDWMRMVSTAWGHSLRREVGTALGRLKLLRSLLPEQLLPGAEEELFQLETLIAALIELPISAPLSYEDAIDSVPINELIKTLKRQWEHARYRPIKLHFELQKNLDQLGTVRASREWLRRGLELIIDNAVRAMEKAGSPHKQITVTNQLADNGITISIRDSGPGIPLDVQEKIFKEPIPKPEGSRGSGLGLLLAQTIFQTYRGDIQVTATGPGGTTIAIILPVEVQA